MFKVVGPFDATQHQTFCNYSTLNQCFTPWTFQLVTEGGFIALPNHGTAQQCGFASKESARVDVFDWLTGGDFVAAVTKNSDFTEGRGPMMLHKIFKSPDDAHTYVMNQMGIYGSSQYREIRYGCNIHGDLYGRVTYNGYDINLMRVE